MFQAPWHTLVYAGICWYTLSYARGKLGIGCICFKHAGICRYMLSYAVICCHTLAYARTEINVGRMSLYGLHAKDM